MSASSSFDLIRDYFSDAASDFWSAQSSGIPFREMWSSKTAKEALWEIALAHSDLDFSNEDPDASNDFIDAALKDLFAAPGFQAQLFIELNA